MITVPGWLVILIGSLIVLEILNSFTWLAAEIMEVL